MTRRHAQQRGFAFMLSVALIIMLGMALAAMSSLLATEIRRTRQQASDAQMRQLLTAGWLAARSHLDRRGPQAVPVDVPLPRDLPDARLSVRIEPSQSDADHATVDVAVSLGESRARQTATFEHVATRWHLQSAVLDD